jgi:hypothetical protein
MKFDERAGKRFSIQARKTAKEVLPGSSWQMCGGRWFFVLSGLLLLPRSWRQTSGEYQTTLQQVVLAGDLEAVYVQVRKELSLRPGEPLEENNKSILHYAVMTRNTDIVQMLIRESRDKGVALDLNKNDIITGTHSSLLLLLLLLHPVSCMRSTRVHAVALQHIYREQADADHVARRIQR